MNFSVGDIVTWTSQANASTKTKTGEFLGYVRPNDDAYSYVPEKLRNISSRIKGQRYSTIERAAVRVPRREPKRGDFVPVDYYFPRVSVLAIKS